MTFDERAYQKTYRATHLARKRELANAWNAAHPEERRAKDRAYRAANREKIRLQHAAWRATHPKQKRVHQKKYREVNQQELKAKNKAYAAAHVEAKAAYGKAYYLAHREERRQRDRVYRETQKERIQALRERRRTVYAERRRQWCRSNPDVVATRRLKRRAAEQQAMPAWADAKAIRAFYDEAARLTKSTGIIHEVDHVCPIQGRNVSGLHCEANLQILTASENRQKGNRVTHTDPLL